MAAADAGESGVDPEPPLKGALGLWAWDLVGETVRGDARFAALLGVPAEDALAGLPAQAFFARVHPDDRLRLTIAVAGVAQGAEVFARDFRIPGEDGVRWVSARGRAEHQPDRRPRAFTGVLTDISEQKRVEERLRIAQGAGGVGTFEFVEGFATVAVSDQFCRLLGLRVAASLPVHTINALVEPDQPPLIGGAAEETTIDAEVRIRRADTGEVRWLAVRGERRPAADAVGPTTLGAIYDITAAKVAEARLRELARTLEERVEARTQERDRLWNASRDLFGVVGRDGVYRSVNPAWRRLLGYDEADVVGRSFQDFVQPDDLAAAQRQWVGGGAGAALEDFDARMRAKDGAWRWVNWTVIPQGEAFYAVGRDVTERKQLEQQLRQSQKMEAVGQLTGGIAHDFNNMLTGVLGGLDMIQRRLSEGRIADAGRFITGAITSAERAAALTHRLLAFSRQQTLDPQSVDANALVGSMEDLLRRTLGERIDLAVELDPGLWRTAVDANQLESALLNLAINARDAMADGGKLTIETANVRLAEGAADGLEAGEYVQLSVSDTGSGMSPEVMARVFDPFFTTKPLGQGTGLGLSMVFGFARQSGGDVTIYSEVERGTTVRLYLPRHLGEDVQDLARPVAAAPPTGSGEAVLVVEDDPSVRPVVVELLRELGYEAIEVSSSEDALQVLRSPRRIDLMVSDVGLPGLNGRQLAERAREARPDLPVLFMTGYAAGAARRSEFLGPGMEMISKPFAMDALAQKIREMIGR
ncbi:PAS domain S-box protein [Phenylobacterium sp. J426]|uniref:hybrid sensor histidine kinase/response regulator n=1 Tax=Phenylobacterium sp. J426 TaxID=2898439 RepID=UPI0021515588|nr:PAS domain S-box protein [Phenylobacterium sp. J426]MCR5874536.1 PAS domain S-box protein [Phenylobacterium sp. J426]